MTDLAPVQVQVLGPGSTREELVAALLQVNREARRTMRRDRLGRENARWADLHEFINAILDFMEE